MNDEILLPATYDCMFKALMLNKKLKPFLKELINIITGIPIDALEKIEILNSEYTINNKNDKKMKSDVIVSIGNKYINIEMNREYYRGVFNKNGAYINKLKTSLYKEWENYYDAGQVIQINFNDFYHFKHRKDIYKFVFLEEETHEIDEDSTVKYHVCLFNIWNRCYNKDAKKLTRFEKFCLILKSETKEYAKKISGDDEVMGNIVDEIARLSKDNTMLGLYDAEVEAEKIRKTRLKGARQEGLEQGIKQGIEQGIEQGKREMIMPMYKDGVAIEKIAAYANITIEEVNNLLEFKED